MASGLGTGPFTLPRWSWLNIRTIANQKIGRWGWDFHTVRGGINPDDIRVCPRVVGVVDVCGWIPTRYVTLLCPGDAYFVYESRPMSDQTKMTVFLFSSMNARA